MSYIIFKVERKSLRPIGKNENGENNKFRRLTETDITLQTNVYDKCVGSSLVK